MYYELCIIVKEAKQKLRRESERGLRFVIQYGNWYKNIINLAFCRPVSFRAFKVTRHSRLSCTSSMESESTFKYTLIHLQLNLHSSYWIKWSNQLEGDFLHFSFRWDWWRLFGNKRHIIKVLLSKFYFWSLLIKFLILQRTNFHYTRI